MRRERLSDWWVRLPVDPHRSETFSVGAGAREATVGGLGERLEWGGGTDGRDAPEALSLSRLHLIGGREFS